MCVVLSGGELAVRRFTDFYYKLDKLTLKKLTLILGGEVSIAGIFF